MAEDEKSVRPKEAKPAAGGIQRSYSREDPVMSLMVRKRRTELEDELSYIQTLNKPVTGTDSRNKVNRFFARRINVQADTRSRGVVNEDEVEQHRPEEITIEVQGLLQRGSVSTYLSSRKFRRSLEDTIRRGITSRETPVPVNNDSSEAEFRRPSSKRPVVKSDEVQQLRELNTTERQQIQNHKRSERYIDGNQKRVVYRKMSPQTDYRNVSRYGSDIPELAGEYIQSTSPPGKERRVPVTTRQSPVKSLTPEQYTDKKRKSPAYLVTTADDSQLRPPAARAPALPPPPPSTTISGSCIPPPPPPPPPPMSPLWNVPAASLSMDTRCTAFPPSSSARKSREPEDSGEKHVKGVFPSSRSSEIDERAVEWIGEGFDSSVDDDENDPPLSETLARIRPPPRPLRRVTQLPPSTSDLSPILERSESRLSKSVGLEEEFYDDAEGQYESYEEPQSFESREDEDEGYRIITMRDLTEVEMMRRATRDDLIMEITELVHRHIVTETLSSESKHQRLLNVTQAQLNQIDEGSRRRAIDEIRSLPRSRVRRNDFSHFGIEHGRLHQNNRDAELDEAVSVINATASATIPYVQTSAAMQAEMSQMRSQMTELSNLVKMSMNIQVDIQRSIRQEVAAAMNQHRADEHVEPIKVPTYHSRPSADFSCIVCLDSQADALFYRCGHICTCFHCACKILEGPKSRDCPVCRAPIVDVVRAYRIEVE